MHGIEVADAQRVRTITFERPERRNAMDLAMFAAYYDALAAADADPQVRAIVVTGRGGSFCAGAEASLLDALQGDEAQQALQDALGQPAHLPLTLGTPLIAAVNGSAAGLGLVHALYADLRFAAEHAQFSTVFARLGLIAEHGSAWLLPRLIGPAHALDLLLSARKVTAAEAHAIGLVQKVLPRDEVLGAAQAYAQQLAEHCSPSSLAVIREQVWRGLAQDGPTAVGESLELMTGSFATADFKEAMAALGERRRPAFGGVV
ncbi:enoyl-CoA hydratase-related protein [Actinoplanes sp. TFC3]|uniref:enoyl-CoA hydratase-related protein n=1 Tax=Actinoplanes sp. TFC3 TaxID=1710355 RepID=UPI000835BE18|nr:enoyl-CoA hydratase-related protein [Actinoplanes sp. TFC3]